MPFLYWLFRRLNFGRGFAEKGFFRHRIMTDRIFPVLVFRIGPILHFVRKIVRKKWKLIKLGMAREL